MPGTPLARAIAQIRAAEAARMIGLLDDAVLVAQADDWVAAGVESDSLTTLVSGETTPALRAGLLADVAASVGVHFATRSDARSVHAMTVIDQMTKSGDLVGDVMRFSNNYTDEVSGKMHGAFGRLFRRKS
jgi:hypothetical protein